jgi:hypothetical protein
LAKNRRTGQTVKAWFTMLGGRFCFNNERNSAEELVNPTVVKKEEVKPVVAKNSISEAKKEAASVEDLFNALTIASEQEERDKPF